MFAPPPSRRRVRPRRKGVTLLLVLGLVFVMSLVLAAFLQLVERELKLKALYGDNDELRVQAYSALEATAAVLGMFAETDGGFYAPTQGWDMPLVWASLDPLEVTLEDDCGIAALEYPEDEEDDDVKAARLAAMSPEARARAEALAARPLRDIFKYPPLVFPNGIEVDVQIEDESAKIPLTARYAELIFELFKSLEISESTAKDLTECFVDWIDADDDMLPNGAEQNYYDATTPAVLVPNRALRTYDELRLVKGFAETFFDAYDQPNDKWRAFRARTTLHTHNALNLNTLPREILEIFEERGDLSVDTVVTYRAGSDGVEGTPDDKIIRELSDVSVSKSEAAAATGETLDSVLGGSGSLAKYLTTSCQLLRIRVIARRGESRFVLSLLVTPASPKKGGGGGSSKAPFTIKKILENREIE